MTNVLSPEQLALVKAWLGTGSINIFGLPFAGKDTHGATLSQIFDAPLLGGGDILRGSYDYMSPEVRKDFDGGKLFPPDEYLRIVTPYLSKPEFTDRSLILSSVGRWIGEEQGVIKATEASNHPTKAVIYLTISEEVLHARWEKSQQAGDRGGRADDAQHVLETRIHEFRTKTLPVIEVYRQKDLLIEINSDADKQEVLESIFARLLVLATSHAAA